MTRRILKLRVVFLHTLLLAVLTATAALVSENSFGGPPDLPPLKFTDEAAGLATAAVDVNANDTGRDENEAYFYQQGKKVYLHDTGMAVAQLKPEIVANAAELSFETNRPASNTALGRIIPQLEKRGMVLVNTSGPNALDLMAAAAGRPNEIAYMMPVVAVADGGQDDDNTLVMTADICVRFKRGTSEERVQEMLMEHGLTVKRKQKFEPNAYVVKLPDDKINYNSVLRAANSLFESGSGDGTVLYAFPDFLVPTKRHATPVPDPSFPDQWHLQNTGQGHGEAGQDVKAVDAWTVTMGSPDIRIAIIDDCVDKDHPDLQANFVEGLYFREDGSTEDDPSPRDGTQRHGTSCAGVAVACSNAIGGCGVAPNCKLIGVNFWDAPSPSQVSEAFYFCEARQASVISCSWSWNFAFDNVRVAINDLVTNGRDGKGIIVLFAAGNDYGRINTRQKFGTLPEVMCIGAVNWRGEHSAYSNSGPELCVVAPSNDIDTQNAFGILTTDNRDLLPKARGRNYSGYIAGDFTPGNQKPEAFGGTSSATPLVAGICGLVLSANGELTAQQVREIIESTADKITGGTGRQANYVDGHDEYYGRGRVNAFEAVKKAVAMGDGQ